MHFFLLFTLCEVLLLLFALAGHIVAPGLFRLRFHCASRDFLLAVLVGTGCFLILLLLGLYPSFTEAVTMFHRSFQKVPLMFSLPVTLLLVPLAEEGIFRGVLPAITGPVLSNVLFGILHMRSGYTILVPLAAILIGFVFHKAYEHSGRNLFVPVVAHVLFNALRLAVFVHWA